jgi:hypothetical protein
LKNGPSVAGIEKKSRDILRMVLDDQLRGVAAGEPDTIRRDRLDKLSLCLCSQEEKHI